MTNHNPESSKDYMTKTPVVMIKIDAAPKGEWKALGGSDRDQWNKRLSDLVTNALPVNQQNTKEVSDAGSAVAAGIMDMKPADPVEGILISQLAVANEAALKLYQLAWLNSGHLEASTKYLQLADRNICSSLTKPRCAFDRAARPASRSGPAANRCEARHRQC